jgi:3-hydroxyisobutyrate dehydrogenase-like beta-hydroxyacid dehydrogenase
MGSALAGAFIDRGNTTTVWNRSSDRCDPLAERGARVAASAVAAVAASPLTVACLSTYEVMRAVLDVEDAAATWMGRAVVNLTSGSPAEAEEAESWLERKGARYLDGAIPVYPHSIGADDTAIIYAGNPDTWEQHRALLLCLGGASRLVGEEIAAANATTVALSSYYHVALLGFLEAVAYSLAVGIDPDGLIELAAMRTRLLEESMSRSVQLVRGGDFASDESALTAHLEALANFKSAMESAGVRTRLVSQAVAYLEASVNAGRSELDIAAALEVMKPGARPD